MSLNLTSAASFQAYVQDYYDQLLSKLYVGFDSANYCTSHEGVKGKIALTQLVIGNLVKRYSSTFTVTQDAIDFIPRNLEVVNAKVDLSIVPKDFESTYLGMFRKKGQDSVDIPFEGYIIEGLLAQIAAEQEMAFHRAVTAVAPASTDLLAALFDGTKEIIKDEVGNLSPVTTGALTSSNAFTAIESVFETVGSQYQSGGIEVFISPKTNIYAGKQYRADYGKYNDGNNEKKSDWGIANLNPIVTPGFPDNCILITPKENIHHGYDGPMDASMLNFEQEDRRIKMWADFNMGVNFGIINPELMGINNQFTV